MKAATPKELTHDERRVALTPDTATKLIAKVHNIDMVPHGPYTAIMLAK